MADEHRWGAAEYLVPQLSSSTRYGIAISGNALGILFDNAQIQFLPKADGRLNESWFGSVAFPLTNSDPIELRARFQGHLTKTATSSATLLVAAAGQVHVQSYGYGTVADLAQSKIDFSFNLRIEPPMDKHVTVTVILLAERQSRDSELLFVADAIDFGAL